jgi:hypothetical protein
LGHGLLYALSGGQEGHRTRCRLPQAVLPAVRE